MVADNQRSRLIAAITEISAEIGYPATSVARIIERAGVSRTTFYAQFSNRRECMVVAFDKWAALLEAEIRAAAAEASDTPAAVRASLRRALDLLASRPAMARLLTMEILAVVPGGAEAQHVVIGRLASRLHTAHESMSTYVPGRPAWEWCAVAGMVALVGKQVAAGEAARLPELEPQLAWIALGGEL